LCDEGGLFGASESFLADLNDNDGKAVLAAADSALSQE
jgi:hypothetical protein